MAKTLYFGNFDLGGHIKNMLEKIPKFRPSQQNPHTIYLNNLLV